MKLWAVADLHAAVPVNRRKVEALGSSDDWIIVAGDVAERIDDVINILAGLARRYATVIWSPGNHELFAKSSDTYKGRARYEELVRRCREIGVLTPEDPYAVFDGVTICPLFTLYDYSFGGDALVERAHRTGRVLTDAYAIAPYVDIRAWCWDRLAYSIKRLSRVEGPTVLVNHWPLAHQPVKNLCMPEIAPWCGTRHTQGWAVRYNARAVVYGHLHIPGEMYIDGVRHVEASLGYPREWSASKHRWPVEILEAGGSNV